MEQRLEELRKENNQEAIEYFDFIKSSVNDGSYFKDGLNWYFFRYIVPICDRTLLIFGAILAAVVLFFLVQMFRSAFPLVEKVPVFINSQDDVNYFPYIFPLKSQNYLNNKAQTPSVDDLVIQYLISKYIENRESYDFSKAEIEGVNEKFNQIRNVSTDEEYKSFQTMMSKDNPDSPLNFFGQNVSKSIKIESINLIKKQPKNLTAQAKDFILAEIPSEAEVRFISTVQTSTAEGLKQERERYFAKISFDFNGVDRGNKGEIKFTVKGYRLFKVQ